MKQIEGLGISPAPWRFAVDHTPWRANILAVNASDGDEVVRDCSEADGRLIAAAPELYEAARLAYVLLSNMIEGDQQEGLVTDGCAVRETLRKALEKAGGAR